jgi:hypothetical protein
MKKYIGWVFVLLATAPVAAFLGVHEVQFFSNTFREGTNQMMAYLGYMLTGGGLFLWLGIFVLHAKSELQKATSFIMIVVCTLGALAVALFNIYMTTMSENGYLMTKEDIQNMTVVIGILAAFHMLALIAEGAGGAIVHAFQDDDGDGIINAIDRHDNRQGQPKQNNQPKSQKNYQKREPFFKKWFRRPAPQMVVNNSDVELQELRAENERLKASQTQQDGQGATKHADAGKDTPKA